MVRLLLLLPIAAVGVSRGGPKPSVMIQKVQQRLSEEADADKTVFDNAGCWCQRNQQEKEATVESMQNDQSALESDIDARSASTRRLDLELGGHEKELADNQKALATAEALREKEAAEFADNEQSQAVNVDSLDNALHAVKNSPEMVLAGSLEQQMANMFKKTRDTDGVAFLQTRPRMLLQLSDAIAQRQAPDVVYGVLKTMRSNFGEDLEAMRHREAGAQEDHKALVDAKSQEIKALEKQVLSKKQRAATGKVQVQEKTEQKERSEKLLEANQALRIAMKDFCDANDQGYQNRYKAREAENLALADAMVDVADGQSTSAMMDVTGANFLAVGKREFPDSLEGVTAGVGGPADDLCMAVLGIVDTVWRKKGKAACNAAKGGALQDAASQVEDLEDLIREEVQAKKNEREECAHEREEVASAAADATEQNQATEGVVKSDFESTSDALADVLKQAEAALQAKDDINGIDGTQHEEMQKIRAAAVHDEEILAKAASHAGDPASGKINAAIQQLNTLADTAISYDNERAALVQKVSSALDEVQKAAQKSSIPLRMIKAEDEEDAIKVKEDGEEISHVHKPNCDLNTIQARQGQLNEYLNKLGSAAEKLAWGSLR